MNKVEYKFKIGDRVTFKSSGYLYNSGMTSYERADLLGGKRFTVAEQKLFLKASAYVLDGIESYYPFLESLFVSDTRTRAENEKYLAEVIESFDGWNDYKAVGYFDTKELFYLDSIDDTKELSDEQLDMFVGKLMTKYEKLRNGLIVVQAKYGVGNEVRFKPEIELRQKGVNHKVAKAYGGKKYTVAEVISLANSGWIYKLYDNADGCVWTDWYFEE